jgi:hypothetical protein
MKNIKKQNQTIQDQDIGVQEEEQNINSKTPIKNTVNYNFIDNTESGAIPSTALKTFAQNKKNEINHKIFQRKFNQNNSAIIVMVALIICLIGLCGFAVYYIHQYENKTQKIGTTIAKETSIIASDGFSFVLDKNIPAGYSKKSERIDFEWIVGKKGFQNSYLATEEIDTETVINGVSVQTAEYDNRYGLQNFAELVQSKLGADYNIDAEKLNLAGNIIAQKITNTKPREQINYYVAVSSDNYYVIKVYTQGKNTIANDKSDYATQILTKLRLN